MNVNFLIYGVFVYFAALLVSGVLALSAVHLKKAQSIFVAANTLGFMLGLGYFANFAGQTIVIVSWTQLFNFSPSLNLLSAIFFTIISGVSALVGIYSVRYLELYKDTYNPTSTQFLIALFVLGMQGVLFTNNAFTFLFFWEVMSISSFFLVFADKTDESIKAAFLYFIMTHLGASAILGGFLILSHGNLLFDFSNITSATQALPPTMVALSFVLFLFGFGSKAGLVPFHVWLPEAHPQAPSNVSALMSGLMLKVAVFGFIKVAFSFTNLPTWAGLVVVCLGLLSAMLGVLHAATERDMKRAFAFSSIENMGIIFTILGLAIYLITSSSSPMILAFANILVVFAIFHALSHALFKTALFLSSGVVISRVHSKSLEFMGGMAKIMPIFSFAFLIAILASLPLPPFGTFYGEWGFVQNMINLLHSQMLGTDVQITILVILAIVGLVSGLAVFAMVKIFGISMLGLTRAKHLEKRAEKMDYLLIWPIMILAAGTLVLGVLAKNIIAYLNANAALFATSPVGNITVKNSNLSSVGIFLVPVFFLVVTWLAKKYLVKEKSERTYHTWDCGQPINAGMEYTATAFSAPIRFFFLQLLRRVNILKSTPVVETNPWIRKYSFSLVFTSFWRDSLYHPVAEILKYFADRIKVIQGGRIQYYLLFVLGTLIVTLIIVL